MSWYDTEYIVYLSYISEPHLGMAFSPGTKKVVTLVGGSWLFCGD